MQDRQQLPSLRNQPLSLAQVEHADQAHGVIPLYMKLIAAERGKGKTDRDPLAPPSESGSKGGNGKLGGREALPDI